MKTWMPRPCADCPFRKVGAIKLRPGRLAGIIESLQNDLIVFHCHKTVHSQLGGEWTDDGYLASGNEAICMGSLAYAYKGGAKIPVAARFLMAIEPSKFDDVRASADAVIDP